MSLFKKKTVEHMTETETENAIIGFIRKEQEAAVVGKTLATLERSRVTFENQIDVLTAEIKSQIEHRRQLIASMKAVSLAISSLATDPSLTPEQKQAADRELVSLDLSDITLEP